MPIGARRMTHHRAFWSSSRTDSLRVEDRLGLVAELEGGDTGDGGHEDDLQDVQLGERRDDVRRDDPGQEVEPGAGVLGLGAVLRGEAGAGARVGDQADREADGDRDQRGDHEPEQRARGQPGGVVDLPQVGDRHQDREEDERGDGQLQQLDEDAADLVQRGDEPADVLAAGEPAEQDAEDETGDDLGPERELGGYRKPDRRLLGCRLRRARDSRTRTHSE